MKGMPSPFDFETVVKNSCSSVADYFSGKNCFSSDNSFCEPISVLDSRIPSGPTSSSTPSSSLGGGSSGDTAGAAAASVSDRRASPKWQQDSTTATSSSAAGIDSELLPVPPILAEKCAMEDWESVLSESAAASPGQEQSIFRWIEDPAIGSLNKFRSTAAEFDFSGGFGVMDQAFAEENVGPNFIPNFSNNNRSSSEKIDSATNNASANPVKFHHNSTNNYGEISIHHLAAFNSPAEMKPPILINQQQAYFLPFSYAQEQEPAAAAPPPPKRLNPGGGQISKGAFGDARQQLNEQQQQLQFLPHYLHHRPKTSGSDELQQAIIEELYKAAASLQAGNPALAQGILARLNQHLSPTGNPFHRAAFYCKEALQLLLPSAARSSPPSLVFKIGAYKSFSEISPFIDFANFTTNQSILEAVEGFDRIHIVDFDIGYGGQWASLMQELALQLNGAPLLKITAVVSPSTHDQLELSLIRENLIQFANEMNLGFELEIMGIDSFSSWFRPSENEAVAVNVPHGCLTNHQVSAPLLLRFVKQLAPRIVVSVERGCDRTDLPFPEHMVHAVEACSALLESLDAANADAVRKIERLFVQAVMEKVVMSAGAEKSQQWRSVLLSCGFYPIAFSSFAESMGELVVKKSGGGGFQVEKRRSSLLLCWQRKELLSVSLWKC